MSTQNPEEMLFLELKARFGDEKVAQLLVVAARDYKVKIDVRPLVTVQLNYWQQGGKTADDIFNLLKLSEVGDKLFESPMLLTWRAYVANLDPKKTDELIFSVMKKYYDGDILEKMFADAKKRSATTRSMASNLEEEMWRSQGKTADNLFKFLKLDEKGDDLFESPVLGTWVSYINRLNTYEKRPDEFVVINELEKRFGYVDLARILGKTEGMRGDNVEIVASLRKLQFKQWMTQKLLDPKRVDKLLIQSPDDPRNTRVTLDFYDFYKANGGPPLY